LTFLNHKNLVHLTKVHTVVTDYRIEFANYDLTPLIFLNIIKRVIEYIFPSLIFKRIHHFFYGFLNNSLIFSVINFIFEDSSKAPTLSLIINRLIVIHVQNVLLAKNFTKVIVLNLNILDKLF
jgi:hypothetical protein